MLSCYGSSTFTRRSLGHQRSPRTSLCWAVLRATQRHAVSARAVLHPRDPDAVSPRQATALRLCEQLAKQLKPLARPTCRTARVEGGNSHYQRVYLRQHDDEALTAWHEAARAVFHTPAALGTAFMPHLSIVYGDLSAEETQHRVQAGEAALMDVDTTFSPGTLALWSTPAGKTETWAELAVINV